MSILKIKKQDFPLLKQTHSDLYTTITSTFPELDDATKGKIAGLCIEYVIQSDGDVDIFQEEISVDKDMEDDFDEIGDFN